MKKLLFSIVTVLVTSVTLHAQVGIGTVTPEGALDVVSTNSGVVLPRVANTAAVTTPVPGMIVYDLSEHCMKTYNNSEWTGCIASPLTVADIVAASDNPAAEGTPTIADLQTVGITRTRDHLQTAYEEAIATASPEPETVAQLQIIIDNVNTSDDVLTLIGNDAADGTATSSTVTIAQLNSIIPTVNDIDPTLEIAYQEYIDNNPGLFSNPATQIEVQNMVTAVNNATSVSAAVLAQIGNEADDPDTVNSVVTVAQLNSIIPTVNDIDPTLQIAYQEYIDNNSGLFSNPATQIEVQNMVTAVNAANVFSGDADFTLPQTEFITSVYEVGPPVTELKGVIDNGSNQIVINVPYTNGTGSYSTYTSTPLAVTGEGGDANSLTISYPGGTFSASGTIPVTVTVDGDGTFDVEQQAFGIIATIATFDFKVNRNSKGNIVLDASGAILDRAFGDGVHDFMYLPVVSTTTGKTWLNNNLGAHYADMNHTNFDPAQQATASNDHLAYGSLYQWGRQSDGHELITYTNGTPTGATPVNSGTQNGPISTSTPGHSDFIVNGSYPNDWLTPQNGTLWIGLNSPNNPCPSGYRVPLRPELEAERVAGFPTNDNTGAFNSPLKLTAAGTRTNSASFTDSGSYGNYWTGTVASTSTLAFYLRFHSGDALITSIARGNSFSVRCIKN